MTRSIETKRVVDKDPYSEELLDIERVTSSSGVAVRGVIPSPTITTSISSADFGLGVA
jgi:hypothetical protein